MARASRCSQQHGYPYPALCLGIDASLPHPYPTLHPLLFDAERAVPPPPLDICPFYHRHGRPPPPPSLLITLRLLPILTRYWSLLAF